MQIRAFHFAFLALYKNSTGVLTKTLLVMKMTMIFLLAGALQLSAKSIGQTVTYSAKSVELEQVFSVIKEQTGYVFFYDRQDISSAKKVSVKWKNTGLESAVQQLLSGLSLTYEILPNTILITKKQLPVTEVNPHLHLETVSPFTGIVRDKDGNPLAGVNISIKGTKRGVVTNGDGSFSIEADINDILVISYVGYQTTEERLLNNGVLTVNLKRLDSELDEAVVMAYGRTTQRFSTSNISTVKSIDIERQPVNNPLLALQGRIPGVVITPANGMAGSGVKVTIQGATTLDGFYTKNDPLYVIDGIPYTSQLLPNYGNILGSSGTQFSGGESGSPLSFINPANIERIDVLKDADATAIYGSRAANGAILITTKKGKIGSTQVTANVQYGFSKVKQHIDMMKTPAYLQLRHEAFENYNLIPSNVRGTISYAPDLTLWDTTRYTDWQKELLGKTAYQMNAQVSVSGGRENTSYFMSANYGVQEAIFPVLKDDYKDRKGSLHFSLNTCSDNTRFNMSMSGSYMFDENRLPQYDFTSVALTTSPNAPALFNSEGKINWQPNSDGFSTFKNPMASMYTSYRARTSNLISNLSLSYELIKDLTIKTTLGYNYMHAVDYNYQPLDALMPEFAAFFTRQSNSSNNVINNWSAEPQLLYGRKIWKGKFDGVLGASFQQENRDGLQLQASGFISDVAMKDISQAESVTTSGRFLSTYKYSAAFARLNYILLDRYVINLSGRRDGSSKFGEKSRFHDFGSVGLAWIFSAENWFKNIKNIINYGKIRASYGTTGNDQILDYLYMPGFGSYNPGGIAYQGVPALLSFFLPNPYIHWELTKKFTAGIELSALQNRVSLNVNYIKNRTSGQLMPYDLPNTTGFYNITKNFPGLVENSSWEAIVSTVNIQKSNFQWKTYLNFTIPRNKLLQFEGIENSSYSSKYEIGKPITGIKVLRFAGVNSTTGLYQFYDAGGNIVNTPNLPLDNSVFINLAPTFFGGLQNSVSFRNFQLDFFFQYVNQTAQNSSLLGIGVPGTINNAPADLVDRWTVKNPSATLQKSSYSVVTDVRQGYLNALSSDRGYENASFIRLKNVNISYTFPSDILRTTGLKSVKIYAQAQNVWTITKYKGLDPEIPNAYSLPNLLTVIFGAQISL